MDAARTANVEKVKALIAAGADVNAKDKDGEKALMRAESIQAAWAREGCIEVVKVLLAAGADINAKNNDGETALMFLGKSCGYRSRTDIIQLLKKAEANK